MSLAPHLWRSLPNLDLTPADRKILAILERAARLAKSPKFQTGLDDIALAAEVSKRTVQRAILRLIEAGLVKKTTSEEWNRHIPNTYELVRNWRNTRFDPPVQGTGLTPLDYPGAKGWLVPTVARWVTEIQPKRFVDAFCGGGTVGLAVARLKLAEEIVMIDRDPDVAAFWRTVFEDTGGIDWLCDQCEALPVMQNHILQLLKSTPKTTRDRAFRRLLQSVFCFNGICRPDNATHLTRGRMSRWNPTRIMQRLCFLGRLRNRIRFVEGDCLPWIKRSSHSATVHYFDPPYRSYADGKDRLYATPDVRSRDLFKAIAGLKEPWIMSNENSWMIRDACERQRWQYKAIAVRSNIGFRTGKVSSELIVSRDFSNLNFVGLQEVEIPEE